MKLPTAFLICFLGFHIIPANMTATPSSCDACIKTTRSGTKTQSTLIYHTLKPECNSTMVSPCLHNNTQYARCYTKQGIQCYEPKAVGPITASLYVYAYKGGSSSDLASTFSTSQAKNGYITHNVTRGGTNTSVCFDACFAINKGQGPNDAAGVTCGSHSWQRSYLQERKYLFQKVSGTNVGATTVYNYWYTPPIDSAQIRGPQNVNITLKSTSTSCSLDTCNPICLHTNLPQSEGVQYRFLGLGIESPGRDPYGYLVLRIHTTSIKSTPSKVFWEYQEQIDKLNQLLIPPKAHNMFINLAETIAKELTVKNCFVCGGTNMGDQWPWNAQEANYTDLLQEQQNFTYTQSSNETWLLSVNLVGHVCFERNSTNRSIPVGSLLCLGVWNNNTWWSNSSSPAPNNSLAQMTNMTFLKDPENNTLQWHSPDGLYWICGRYAYNILPAGWYGSCVLGAISPSFFLLPLRTKQHLGVPVYDDVGHLSKRSVQIGDWKDNEWPPQRIIHYYGPATWAQDGTWGYRTPIYMLNRIIRLQAVLEIITNETALALKTLAKESALSRTYIMQNRLALDYLLAKEGGVCGKFNLSNCCIEVDDSGKVIQQITDRMIKIAHVPVQTWNGLDFRDMFGSWFPKLPGLQAIVALIGMIAAGCIILPCVLPIFVRTISNSLSLLAEKKATAQVMALWNQQITNTYEPLPSEEVMGDPTCDDPDENEMFVMVEEVTSTMDNISIHSTLAYAPDKGCCWN